MLKKTTTIRENYQFRSLYRRGKSNVFPCVVAYCRRNGKKENRLGITATKKIGGAVQRNRARRVILEAYRLTEDRFPAGWDMVIVARSRATHVKMQVVQAELERLAVKLSPTQRQAGPAPRRKDNS